MQTRHTKHVYHPTIWEYLSWYPRGVWYLQFITMSGRMDTKCSSLAPVPVPSREGSECMVNFFPWLLQGVSLNYKVGTIISPPFAVLIAYIGIIRRRGELEVISLFLAFRRTCDCGVASFIDLKHINGLSSLKN
ncbi:hypothetical protein BDV25DRAFT_149233 [Aspergillus avenaceus]|uniref:Uncharacterized protein n=1 Tax=Aspergillus avenaceus TaxID=36643 RepID=A0A5N6U4G5_ASPAV|nr:hypothetical protein BDV25DRAFT_149233 [Aspergillus avenaceus]